MLRLFFFVLVIITENIFRIKHSFGMCQNYQCHYSQNLETIVFDGPNNNDSAMIIVSFVFVSIFVFVRVYDNCFHPFVCLFATVVEHSFEFAFRFVTIVIFILLLLFLYFSVLLLYCNYTTVELCVLLVEQNSLPEFYKALFIIIVICCRSSSCCCCTNTSNTHSNVCT